MVARSYNVKVLSDPQVLFHDGKTEIVVVVIPLSELPKEGNDNICSPIPALLCCIAEKGDVGIISERPGLEGNAVPRQLVGARRSK